MPEKVDEWAKRLPKNQAVVLYCVRGGSVSNGMVDAIRGLGHDACFVEGGIEGWKASGGETFFK